VLRKPDKTLVRATTDVPSTYEGFDVVDHRREIDTKWSRNSLAVKLREDDLIAWGVHDVLRMRSRAGAVRQSTRRQSLVQPILPPPPTLERRAVADALLPHGRALAASIGGAAARFTPNAEANGMLHADPFAFLIAVINDQGILAERAWAIPFELRRRLGHFDPVRMASDADAFGLRSRRRPSSTGSSTGSPAGYTPRRRSCWSVTGATPPGSGPFVVSTSTR
jgi:hypothetical protein